MNDLESRNRELAILNEIAQRLNREVRLQNALDATLRLTVDLLGLRTGWIWLMDKEKTSTFLAAGYNLPPVLTQDPTRLTGWCYCIEKYLTGDLSVAANINEIACTRLKELKEGTDRLRFHASVPLFSGGGKLCLIRNGSYGSLFFQFWALNWPINWAGLRQKSGDNPILSMIS